MSENLRIGFQIMGAGMGGIFAAIIVIMVFVWLLQKADGGKEKEE
ncbi:MAG: hypothetical protein PUB98_02225 [Clostridiales bacterium]|nr:hypothetical protein [Clostridiales bacterium]